jgi:hypothetical protein
VIVVSPAGTLTSRKVARSLAELALCPKAIAESTNRNVNSDIESLMINLLDAPPGATPGDIWQ